MHNSQEWDRLTPKEKERMLQDFGRTGYHNPKGWEIDQMIKQKNERSRHQSQNNFFNETKSNTGGEIPL